MIYGERSVMLSRSTSVHRSCGLLRPFIRAFLSDLISFAAEQGLTRCSDAGIGSRPSSQPGHGRSSLLVELTGGLSMNNFVVIPFPLFRTEGGCVRANRVGNNATATEGDCGGCRSSGCRSLQNPS